MQETLEEALEGRGSRRGPLATFHLGRSIQFFIPTRPVPRGDPHFGKWGNPMYSINYRAWAKLARSKVLEAMEATGWQTVPSDVPVFAFSEYRYAAPKRLLKNEAWRYCFPISKGYGDADKLTRSVGDAVPNWVKKLKRKAGIFAKTYPGLIQDDGQIIGWTVVKVWVATEAEQGTSVELVEVVR